MFKLSLVISIISILYYFYQVPSGLEPTIWKNPTPLNKLEKNDILKNVIKLHENSSIVAPESFGFDTITGYVYGGLADGRVVQFDQHGAYIKDVLFTGGYVRYHKHQQQSNHNTDNAADGNTYNGIKGNEVLLQYCQNEVKAHRLAWNTTAERMCGRPLGHRVVVTTTTTNDDNNNNQHHSILYIADAYHGIFEIDLSSYVIRHLVTSQTPIHIPGSGNSNTTIDDTILSLPIKFFNDLDLFGYESTTTNSKPTVTRGGNNNHNNNNQEKIIIFTDTSYKDSRSQNRAELIDGAPRGRLFQYNIHTNTLTVLLCGLHFPNGVQIIPSSFANRRNHRFVLVVELTRFRVLKINYDLLLESLSLDAQSLQEQQQQASTNNNNNNNTTGKRKLIKTSAQTTHRVNLLQCCSNEDTSALHQYLINHSYIQPSTAATRVLTPTTNEQQQPYRNNNREYNPPGGNPNHIVSVFLEGITGVVDNIRLINNQQQISSSSSSGGGSNSGDAKTTTTKEDGNSKNGNKKDKSSSSQAEAPADNHINMTNNNNMYHLYIGAGTKSAQPFSFLHIAYQSNWLRYIVCKLIPMKYIEKLVPKYGLVYKVNLQGKIIGTYQDPTGSHVSMISEAQRHPMTGDVWLGSHSNEYLAILPAKYAV